MNIPRDLSVCPLDRFAISHFESNSIATFTTVVLCHVVTRGTFCHGGFRLAERSQLSRLAVLACADLLHPLLSENMHRHPPSTMLISSSVRLQFWFWSVTSSIFGLRWSFGEFLLALRQRCHACRRWGMLRQIAASGASRIRIRGKTASCRNHRLDAIRRHAAWPKPGYVTDIWRISAAVSDCDGMPA